MSELLREKTVSLADRIDELESQVGTAIEQAQDYDPDSEEFAYIEESVKETKRKIARFEQAQDAMGGGEFTLRELTGGQGMGIRDDLLTAARERGEDSIREGYYKVRAVEESVQEAPDGCPDDLKELPVPVFNWLYTEVDNLTTGTMDETIEDFSLARELEKTEE